MVFSSPTFLGLFLPILLLVYFFGRYRTLALLLGSLLFYSWGEPQAILIMLAVILSNYFGALLIGDATKKEKTMQSKILLTVCIVIDLGVLVAYKYLSFAIVNLNLLLAPMGYSIHNPAIPLPIGISFSIFQTVSYLIDVYRKDVEPQKNIVSFALYVSLFPQLIAGPIVRYKTIAEEIADRTIKLDNISTGFQRFAVGLAKKVLIADCMAGVADVIYSHPVATIPTFYCWLGAIAYMLQIYYDFSGYSDMAIGLGRVFNFHFLENFDFPYCARSVQDFWRRWHISLSTWFRDYLYIPLGGSRCSVWRTYLNLMIVFFLCGLWHGAAWNFVVWGLYQGAGLIIERVGFKKLLDRIPAFIGNIYVLLFALVGWVIFRAPTMKYACVYLKNMFCGSNIKIYDFVDSIKFMTISNGLVLLLGVFFAYPLAGNIFNRLKYNLKIWIIFVLFMTAYIFALTSQYSPFIYFRF